MVFYFNHSNNTSPLYYMCIHDMNRPIVMYVDVLYGEHSLSRALS